MMDWSIGIEKRNYGIRFGGSVVPRELLRTIFLIIPVAGVLLFHLWVRNQVNLIGYEINRLSEREDSLLRTQEKLLSEEARQQSPGVIENIALNQLGMSPLRPEQLLVSRPLVDPAERSLMAMTDRDGH
ncbi:MAG: hypothetical protein LBP68_00670 [Acidobacteriota bacterium]|jgi:hypothetical protein|nr:hypothetical protein [Acidobacteriota bacterium]